MSMIFPAYLLQLGKSIQRGDEAASLRILAVLAAPLTLDRKHGRRSPEGIEALQTLRKARKLHCLPDCTCERAVLPCGCPGGGTTLLNKFRNEDGFISRQRPCGCPVRYAPCKHDLARQIASIEVQHAILAAINPAEYAEPPLPAQAVTIRSRKAQCEAMQQRHTCTCGKCPKRLVKDELTGEMVEVYTSRKCNGYALRRADDRRVAEKDVDTYLRHETTSRRMKLLVSEARSRRTRHASNP